MKNKQLYIVGILISFLIITGCQKEEKVDNSNNKSKTVSTKIKIPPKQKHLDTQEEKDWKELDSIKTVIFRKEGEKEAYYNGTFWYSRNFEEDFRKYRLSFLDNYIKNYPEGEHYYDVLKLYFTYLMEPKYLRSQISVDRKAFLDQQSDNSLRYKQFRALPFDIEARDKRLREGDSLADRFLKSNATPNQKARIEVGVLERDLRIAMELLQNLNIKKEIREADFWFLFDRYYWRSFLDRIDYLIYKYPDYPEWPHLVDAYIKVFTLSFLSPELTEYFWKHFEEITYRPDMFKKHPVIAETHKKTQQTLKAMKNFDETLPLQMQMTDMDGKEINLKDYRGKVVLLDFWDLRCAPCIKEMPHVQALYEKYKGQGFEVIGVCAAGDDSKERVREIIDKQGAKWPQVLDKASNAAISYHSLYKIERLPTVWLLNKEGIIVNKNARGNHLEPLIQKYLHLE